MFPAPTINWAGYPSMIDGMASPNLSVLYAASGDRLGLVAEISEWLNGYCLNAYTVRFEKPVAWLGMDETIYSIAGEASDPAKRPDTYLRVAEHSEIKSTVHPVYNMVGHRGELKHFLLVGLNTCLEVLSASEPEVRRHVDCAAAGLWVQEQLHAFA